MDPANQQQLGVAAPPIADAMMTDIDLDLDLDLDLDPRTGVMGGLSSADFLPVAPIHSNLLYNDVMDAQLAPPQSDIDLATTVNSLAGPGAGPLPTTGFGAPTGNNASSTLTEFTKRRNWSQRVLEELKDFLHVLTPDGRIIYASPSSELLTGYPPSELTGKFIVDFIHNDDNTIFIKEFNESIASGNNLRFFYRFRKKDSTYTIFESHGHPHLAPEVSSYGQPSGQMACGGFFMMARPYPTKNASLLDSFLEHKIENERLTRRISELKREEREEEDSQQRQWQSTNNGTTPSESRADDPDSPASATSPQNIHTLMPPASSTASSTKTKNALTQQNLEDANASQKQDSMSDKMARYEGATHIETIEMLTGLRYRDGERSQGISTGDHSPALIRGDAGIAISVDKDGRGGDRKKKQKVADEYVCTDCGTLDSPEWRKGPSGPKTLCNACGCKSISKYHSCLLLTLQ